VKTPFGIAVTLVMVLVTLAAITPMLIALSSALLPLIAVSTVAALVLRLVFFHTRKW
jgi:hypothetical protein